jgi:hypothetical protein
VKARPIAWPVESVRTRHSVFLTLRLSLKIVVPSEAPSEVLESTECLENNERGLSSTVFSDEEALGSMLDAGSGVSEVGAFFLETRMTYDRQKVEIEVDVQVPLETVSYCCFFS